MIEELESLKALSNEIEGQRQNVLLKNKELSEENCKLNQNLKVTRNLDDLSLDFPISLFLLMFIEITNINIPYST
jgi:hypothetical protein